MLYSAASKMCCDYAAKLLKGVDRSWLKARVPISCSFLEDGWEGLVEDFVSGTMKENENLEALQMVDGVHGPVIRLHLGHLESRWD